VIVEKLQEELAAATAHQQVLQQQVQQQQANIDQQVQGWQKASEEAAAEVRQLTVSIAKVTQQQEVSNTH